MASGRAIGSTAESERIDSIDESIPRMMVSLFRLVDPSGDGVHGGIVHQSQDRWQIAQWHGDECPDLADLASRAADATSTPGTARIVRSNSWAACALRSGPPVSESPMPPSQIPVAPATAPRVLVFRAPAAADGRTSRPDQLDLIVDVIEQYDRWSQQVDLDARRLWQLTTMLREAAQWQRIDNDEALLQSIAECTCEVIGCERATIFLWDSRRKVLIGRPAMGVSGGTLEVEDSVGIVGEVLQTGEPKRWASGGIDEGRVNRRIDRAQNFETRSLLAVPMVDSNGKTIGVFEAINAIDDKARPVPFPAADVWTLSELSRHAASAIASQRTRLQLTRSRDQLIEQAAQSNPLIGHCDAIQEVRAKATKLAATHIGVLILGRNGTGKEIVAQHIHYQSDRRTGPFIAVNCAALVESLLESELFGHEKGAFTDAASTRVGKFELAHGGTLFLDEIGDLSLGGQAKLLRVLEERVVVRVGGSQPIPVNVRVVAATNQPLQELIAAKKFREDLFFRLNASTLTLPPLNRRGDDILELADHFLRHFCAQIGRPVPRLDESARQAMLQHPWPGNVRELRNTIERVCYLTTEAVVNASQLMLQGSVLGEMCESSDPSNTTPAKSSTAVDKLKDATVKFQVAHIGDAIEASGGNMTAAAVRLGLHRSNLYRKMRHLGMPTSGDFENETPGDAGS